MKKILIACMLALPLIATAADTEAMPETNVQNADFVTGKNAVTAKNWQVAVDAFNHALKNDPDNADIHNYLGYSYRNLGNMELSFKHYHEALRLDPNHRGAHNYIGIAYLKVGQPEKAEEHLLRLEKICGQSCGEYLDLKKAITAYKAHKPWNGSW